MDKVEFAKILATLAALYPRYELKKETIAAYHAILGDLSVDLLRAAALQIASRDSPWFPAAGELRAAAFRLLEREAGVPSAGEAWGEVCKRIGDTGSWGTPEFTHPLIQEAIEGIGGWMDICRSEGSRVADRARFLQVYGELAGREREAVAMLPEVRSAVAQLAAGWDAKRLGAGDVKT